MFAYYLSYFFFIKFQTRVSKTDSTLEKHKLLIFSLINITFAFVKPFLLHKKLFAQYYFHGEFLSLQSQNNFHLIPARNFINAEDKSVW